MPPKGSYKYGMPSAQFCQQAKANYLKAHPEWLGESAKKKAKKAAEKKDAPKIYMPNYNPKHRVYMPDYKGARRDYDAKQKHKENLKKVFDSEEFKNIKNLPDHYLRHYNPSLYASSEHVANMRKLKKHPSYQGASDLHNYHPENQYHHRKQMDPTLQKIRMRGVLPKIAQSALDKATNNRRNRNMTADTDTVRDLRHSRKKHHDYIRDELRFHGDLGDTKKRKIKL